MGGVNAQDGGMDTTTEETTSAPPTMDQLKAAVAEDKAAYEVVDAVHKEADRTYRAANQEGPPLDPESVVCPTCKAKADNPCRTRAKRKTTPHSARVAAQQDAPEYVAWQAELKAFRQEVNAADVYKAYTAVRKAEKAFMDADRAETSRKRIEGLDPDTVQLKVYRGHGDRDQDSYCVLEVRSSTGIMPGAWLPKAQVERAIQRGVGVVFVEKPRTPWGPGVLLAPPMHWGF